MVGHAGQSAVVEQAASGAFAHHFWPFVTHVEAAPSSDLHTPSSTHGGPAWHLPAMQTPPAGQLWLLAQPCPPPGVQEPPRQNAFGPHVRSTMHARPVEIAQRPTAPEPVRR